MVDVGIMGMGVFEPFVPVRMSVWFARGVVWRVLMLVMLVVNVAVFVRHWFVHVPVFMSFRNVQPDSRSHQCTRRR
jgi:hypothetical protein